jgi:signal transduction histidine kinase
MNDSTEDFLLIEDDVEIAPSELPGLPPWNVLVVDDDEQVHAVTRLVLRSFRFRDRDLRLISVVSAREALNALQVEQDLALALIDVVMETKTAGLDLVHQIRQELKNRTIRLILRTGQPGHAPEQDVVNNYEIDAYMAKTEISAQKLSTAIIASLRAYEYITEIKALNSGLEEIVAQRTGQLVESNHDLQQANVDLAQAVQTLRQMGDVGRDITANLDADVMFDALYRHVITLLGAPVLSIYRTSPGENTLEFCYGRENGKPQPKIYIPLDSPTSNAAKAARERHEILIEHAPADIPPAPVSGSLQMLSLIFVPLIIDQRLLGVMSIQSDRQSAYGERELLIFRTLCSYVAIALDNANTYRQLQQTQQQLVEQEKLAALGSLVAGVAHELNTPLGNSLMMVSVLQEQLDAFNTKMGSSMQRGDLVAFLEDVQEASTVITRSVLSAADLVSSFKQVAMDRTTAQRRVFDLHNTSHEIIATMTNQIKIAGHQIEMHIPENIAMNSYPGPYGQVVSNFINNALLHGFDGRAQGKMRLSARQLVEGRIQIKFEDNGVGIAQSHLKRIFDPFFTTKMGQGGSGLGLSISYNIVTSLLNGTINVQSDAENGTCFVLDLPLLAPAQVH